MTDYLLFKCNGKRCMVPYDRALIQQSEDDDMKLDISCDGGWFPNSTDHMWEHDPHAGLTWVKDGVPSHELRNLRANERKKERNAPTNHDSTKGNTYD